MTFSKRDDGGIPSEMTATSSSREWSDGMARRIVSPSTVKPGTSPDYIKRLLGGLAAGLILSVFISAGVWALAAGINSKTGSEGTWIGNFCQWLYETPISVGIRESYWVFPIIEGTHLLGIALSVGMLCWFDLRLLGLVLRDEPVTKVWNQVMPAALAGFALMFVTGFLLFWAEAITAYHSVHFWIKLALLALAGMNALIFESTARRNMAEWDTSLVPPPRARMAGLISLVLWTAIVVTGRTMAYTFTVRH